MNKHLAPIALSVGLLGVVGGIAATQAFRPAEKPAQHQVQFVQPAAETVTPTEEPTPTVTVTETVAPVQTTTEPAPVESVAPAPAPAPVERQTPVSQPAPEPVQTTPDAPVAPAPPSGWKPGDPKPGNLPSPTTP